MRTLSGHQALLEIFLASESRTKKGGRIKARPLPLGDKMNFQAELRNSKRIVREWVRANFSDQKLANVVAFNADGKMNFRNPCGCLMGVTYSEPLHAGYGCNRQHYWVARRQDLAQTRRFAALFPTFRIGKAEKAYYFLGLSPAFNDCFGDDRLRQRRFSALLRAEMRRREWRDRSIKEQLMPTTETAATGSGAAA